MATIVRAVSADNDSLMRDACNLWTTYPVDASLYKARRSHGFKWCEFHEEVPQCPANDNKETFRKLTAKLHFEGKEWNGTG